MQSEKIAKVLEASARYTEALEQENGELREKLAEKLKQEKQAKVQPILEKVEGLTGESLSDDLKHKLANDNDVLEIVEKIAQDNDVEPVGDVSLTKTANESAAQSPEDRFGSWCTGE